MNIKISIILALFISMLSLQSNAQSLIDTGAPEPHPIGLGLYYYSPTNYQSVAAKVSFNDAYTVTDISSYFTNNTFSGDLTVNLYKDINGSIGSQIYSQDFYISNANEEGWYGATGLNWNVTSSSYWVAYEVNPLNSGSGGYGGGLGYSVPYPLDNSIKNDASPNWFMVNVPGFGISLRVLWTPVTPVPEPQTYALLFTGLGFITLSLRNKKVRNKIL